MLGSRVMAHVTDSHGHEWTITGHWCESCGMPLHPIWAEAELHPSCDTQGNFGDKT